MSAYELVFGVLLCATSLYPYILIFLDIFSCVVSILIGYEKEKEIIRTQKKL